MPQAFPTAEEILADQARREPDRVALHWLERRLSLGRLAALAGEWALLLGRATPDGRPIGFVLAETPAVVALVLAGWRAGRTMVPLAADLADAELTRRMRLSAPGLVVAHEEHLERTRAAARSCRNPPAIVVLRGRNLRPDTRSKGRARAAPPARPSEIALHAWTERAGPARAALLTHANIVASALRVAAARTDAPGETVLCTRAPSDAIALVSDVIAPLLAGGLVGIVSGEGRESLRHALDASRPALLTVGESGLDVLLAGLPERSLRSLRRLVVRAESLPRTVLRRLHDALPEAAILRAWGYAETAGDVLLARGETLARKPDGLGPPHPGVLVGALAPDGHMLGPRRPGVLALRGSMVMRGYHRDRAATREVLRDGWFRTPDLGYIDDEGEVILTAAGGALAALRAGH